MQTNYVGATAPHQSLTMHAYHSRLPPPPHTFLNARPHTQN